MHENFSYANVSLRNCNMLASCLKQGWRICSETAASVSTVGKEIWGAVAGQEHSSSMVVKKVGLSSTLTSLLDLLARVITREDREAESDFCRPFYRLEGLLNRHHRTQIASHMCILYIKYSCLKYSLSKNLRNVYFFVDG